MSELESNIDIPNLFDFDSLVSLKSAIESYLNISITQISFILDQNQGTYLYPCQTEQDYSQYIEFKQQSPDQIGRFHYKYSLSLPQDFEILSISGTPDLISIHPNTQINKTWILKSKTKFNLVCVEGELEGYLIEPYLIENEIYQFDFSFCAKGRKRLIMLYFKAKSLTNSLFGPMLWASFVIL